MKQFCQSINCKNDLKTVENEIQEIESNISQIRLKLIDKEMKRKAIDIEKNRSEEQLNIMSILINLIEKISLKNKHSIELTQNTTPINETILSYNKLFDPFDYLSAQNSPSPDGISHVKIDINFSQIVNEIVSK
jgi:ribosome-binding ATPase YchF (GTP1/OBG family)